MYVISTHSPRVGRTFSERISSLILPISTHSPRVGRTGHTKRNNNNQYDFNSLAPCGANLLLLYPKKWDFSFQLTRPVWGEPHDSHALPKENGYFNSLAPCGANPQRAGATTLAGAFQLTRPVWGEPKRRCTDDKRKRISTHSPRVGRTGTTPLHCVTLTISTHSPRVGRTQDCPPLDKRAGNFNSLAPCGANPARRVHLKTTYSFQLTRPVWGEPRFDFIMMALLCHFNSLAPCGANLPVRYQPMPAIDFNSLAPCGANPPTRQKSRSCASFQLTRPVWGEPARCAEASLRIAISTHSPRVGRTAWCFP